MQRITQKQLESLVECLNRIVGLEDAGYSTIGAYCLSGAYGGWALHQYTNDKGGIRDIFGGHMPRRELFNLMHAYIQGLYVNLK